MHAAVHVGVGQTHFKPTLLTFLLLFTDYLPPLITFIIRGDEECEALKGELIRDFVYLCGVMPQCCPAEGSTDPTLNRDEGFLGQSPLNLLLNLPSKDSLFRFCSPL